MSEGGKTAGRFVAAILATLTLSGCAQYKKLTGVDSTDTNSRAVLVNGEFNNWTTNATIENPKHDTPLCWKWLTYYGGAGTADADYSVSRVPEGMRFDVRSFKEGPTRAAIRTYQVVDGWQRLTGKTVVARVVVRTNIAGHVQCVIDSGVKGEHYGNEYSNMATGTERSEVLTAVLRVPHDATLLWLKIGQTTKWTPQTGWFIIESASLTVAD